ncbi:MAG: hypothetical protein U0Y08_10450 [Bacteroidia bacterium]
MTKTLRNIIVLRTNVNNVSALSAIAGTLNANPQILRWTIDLEDEDNVLRIESDTLTIKDIITTLQEAGYEAEDLI